MVKVFATAAAISAILFAACAFPQEGPTDVPPVDAGGDTTTTAAPLGPGEACKMYDQFCKQGNVPNFKPPVEVPGAPGVDCESLKKQCSETGGGNLPANGTVPGGVQPPVGGNNTLPGVGGGMPQLPVNQTMPELPGVGGNNTMPQIPPIPQLPGRK